MINRLNSVFNSLLKTKDGKTLVTNFSYLMLLQIASYIFPLLTLPYLARVIGVVGIGKIAFATAVITWLRTITDWGFSFTATRDVARNKRNLNIVSDIFSNVLWARLLLSILSLVLLIISIHYIPYFQENKIILLVTFLLVPGSVFFPEWFFQAMEEMKFITYFSLITKIFFTVSVFVFIKEESDYILQPLLIGIGQIICGIISLYIVLFKWKIKLKKPNFVDIVAILKNSTDVFINNLMPNLYNSLSVVILGIWGGSYANGIYDAGKRLITLINSLMQVVVKVTFPFLSRKLNSHNLFAKIYLGIALLASFFTYLLAPYFISFFYTDSFEAAVLVMRLMSVSIFLIALIRTYGINFLIIKGLEKELRNITIFGSIFGFIISLPLIYFYSYIGAVITIIVAQSILGLGFYFKAKKEIRYDELNNH